MEKVEQLVWRAEMHLRHWSKLIDELAARDHRALLVGNYPDRIRALREKYNLAESQVERLRAAGSDGSSRASAYMACTDLEIALARMLANSGSGTSHAPRLEDHRPIDALPRVKK